MKLRTWVETLLIMWFGLDLFLIVLALYMQRIMEIGL